MVVLIDVMTIAIPDATAPMDPMTGCSLKSMHDITRFTRRANSAPNVSNSNRLPEMPSSLPSRSNDARELSSSMKEEIIAINRLIMLNASPIDLIRANITDVSIPSGSMT